MSSNNTLSVAVIGIPPHEQGILQRIFTLSSYRTAQSYALVPMAADPSPDILLVNGDDQDAVIEFRELSDRDQAKATLPTVIVSSEESISGSPFYHLQRPLLAPRVLQVLDEVALRAQPALPGTAQYKVLVVDDSLPVRKQVELELQPFGIEADLAESGEQALALLNNSPPYDLIFLDVILPGVDGYSLCKIIKRDKRRKQIPVIMLTGKGSPFDRVRGKLAGCDTYLTKPVSRESFQSVVKQYLSQALSNEVAIL